MRIKNFSQEEIASFLEGFYTEHGHLRGALKEIEIAMIDILYEITSDLDEETLKKNTEVRQKAVQKILTILRNYHFAHSLYQKKKKEVKRK